jgi:hypothetical protein
VRRWVFRAYAHSSRFLHRQFPASAEGHHNFLADELIFARSLSHSHRRDKSGGDRSREEHGSGAGITLLKDSRTHGPGIAPTRPTLSSIPTAVALFRWLRHIQPSLCYPLRNVVGIFGGEAGIAYASD